MNLSMKYPLVFRKYYFPFCFGSYYLLGYLYLLDIPIMRKAAEFSADHFSAVFEIVPRYHRMFTYLRASGQAEKTGLVSLALMWVVIVVIVTCLHMAIFRKVTYAAGGENFLNKQGKYGIATIVLATPILLFFYIFLMLIFTPDATLFLSWLHHGDIGNSPFVLMTELITQQLILLLFFFLIYVIHFIYIPIYKSQGKYLTDQ